MVQAEPTGRCLCGAVGHRATGEPKWIANCIARAAGATDAPLTTCADYPAERFGYVVGEPVRPAGKMP